MQIGSSFWIGFIAPVISYFVVQWRSKSGIDDTLDVFPCHGVGGIVGMLATAVFADEGGLIHGDFKLIRVHLIALLLICSYTFLMSWIGFKFIKILMPLEVSKEDEKRGLDLSQHGESVI